MKVVKREEIGAREERMRGLVFCLDSWEGMKEVSMKKVGGREVFIPSRGYRTLLYLAYLRFQERGDNQNFI